VLKLPNGGDRRITKLWITTPADLSTQVLVKFSTEPDSQDWTSIAYDVQGPAANVVTLSENLRRLLNAVVQPYSRLVFGPRNIFVALVAVFVAVFVLTKFFDLLLTYVQLPKGMDPALLQAIFTVIGAILGGLIGWLVGKVLNWLFNMVFPIGAFAIKEGKDRYKSLRNRSALGLAVAAVISLIPLIDLVTKVLNLFLNTSSGN
jgi:membrane protein YqaA with SNARE-associated domain